MSINYTDNVKIFDSITSTKTSDAYDISKRQFLSFQLTTTGVTVFTIDFSNDGTNWVTGCAFLDVTATAIGTYVVSKSVNNTTAGIFVDNGFHYVRIVATVSTGAATVIMQNQG